MNFINQRYSQANNSTQGLVFEKTLEGLAFFSHIVEDDNSGEKGDKRMPAGFYELKIRKEETELTLKHRKDYGAWFKYHIEVTGIPGHSRVYFHSGNDQKATEGCQLLNDQMGNNSIQKEKIGALSLQATKRFYEKVYPHLEAGNKAFYEIRDENTLK